MNRQILSYIVADARPPPQLRCIAQTTRLHQCHGFSVRSSTTTPLLNFDDRQSDCAGQAQDWRSSRVEHVGVPGNEAADRAAKEATGHNPNTPRPSADPDSNHETQHPSNDERRMGAIVGSSQTRQRTLQDRSSARKKDAHHTYWHTQAISSVITQIRTGKISLRAYLHAINKAETDQCQCGYGPQTVRHILGNVETGPKNNTGCGQASYHVWTSNASSVARQWQYKQPR
ncbi:uncharacterized protein PAC_00451 [Phialocephala subalpina]|uniref:RNase H type-1 domain-containing protein n=1 Tax=Phialocephala subalpina TaxID=576137 RepID=A0A1L7WCT6_9HELO|nr:uncharacterized protein PAC_00451 [Phialocephala subalpina]